jgi:hypothetical protein
MDRENACSSIDLNPSDPYFQHLSFFKFFAQTSQGFFFQNSAKYQISTTMSAPKIYFGAGLFMRDQGYNSAEDIKPWLAPLLESKDMICGIDSAVVYGESEEWLGHLGMGTQYGFSIDTKLTGGGHST